MSPRYLVLLVTIQFLLLLSDGASIPRNKTARNPDTRSSSIIKRLSSISVYSTNMTTITTGIAITTLPPITIPYVSMASSEQPRASLGRSLECVRRTARTWKEEAPQQEKDEHEGEGRDKRGKKRCKITNLNLNLNRTTSCLDIPGRFPPITPIYNLNPSHSTGEGACLVGENRRCGPRAILSCGLTMTVRSISRTKKLTKVPEAINHN